MVEERGWDGWSGLMEDEYSLLTLPASALMLLSPTVAPASPCSVPSEVREFMAPALEPAALPASGKRKRRGREGGREGRRRRREGGW